MGLSSYWLIGLILFNEQIFVTLGGKTLLLSMGPGLFSFPVTMLGSVQISDIHLPFLISQNYTITNRTLKISLMYLLKLT